MRLALVAPVLLSLTFIPDAASNPLDESACRLATRAVMGKRYDREIGPARAYFKALLFDLSDRSKEADASARTAPLLCPRGYKLSENDAGPESCEALAPTEGGETPNLTLHKIQNFEITRVDGAVKACATGSYLIFSLIDGEKSHHLCSTTRDGQTKWDANPLPKREEFLEQESKNCDKSATSQNGFKGGATQPANKPAKPATPQKVPVDGSSTPKPGNAR